MFYLNFDDFSFLPPRSNKHFESFFVLNPQLKLIKEREILCLEAGEIMNIRIQQNYNSCERVLGGGS
jgi:hypothetical protein